MSGDRSESARRIGLTVRAVPAELDAATVVGADVVVIDVLRASTTILAALDNGAVGVIPVADVGRARRAAGAGRLLCGERGGLPPEGFDLGNSPLEFTPAAVGGRTVVLTTTNGTAALERTGGARRVLVGCYRNLGAVAAELTLADVDRVVLACGGSGGRPALEDLACAGALTARVRELAPDRFALDDAARIAVAASSAWPSPDAAFRAATHGRHLLTLGFAADLAHCAALDASSEVPRQDGDILNFG